MKNSEFISRAKETHNNKYNYSKVIYVNNYTKVCIICPEHGEFWQTPSAHLSGQGCPKCNGKFRMNHTDFIDKAKKIHNNKYDYSKVEYVNNKTNVTIVCPIHGEFSQKPNNHLNGHGCPMCSKTARLSKWHIIETAKKVHNNKYDYSKVEYINSNSKICIICPEHGEFWQTPYNHMRGMGCPLCNTKKKLSTEEFILKSREVHNNKYDYSKVDYINAITKVCIMCPEHGKFWQVPYLHLQGHGCPECVGKKRYNTQDFINGAIKIHGEKYDYSKVDYVNSHTKVSIICKEHGIFEQLPYDHLNGHGCAKCGKFISTAENDIMLLLEQILPQQRNRSILNGKEIDIYIPSLKLGIEYNGLRWHSEEFGKCNHYHIDKLNECNKQGIKLIQIFEDEWVNHRDICESKLKQICGLNNNPKLFARKCAIREIANNDAKEFLNVNHIQGFASASVYLGCFYNDKLIGVMSFKKEKDGYWDLNRFATDIQYNCVGIGGKLFKYFITHYDFKEIKSFADRRWTTDPTDNLYTKLGFEFVEFTKPDYRYFKNGMIERFHKFNFRKQILHKKYGLPLTMTESEMVSELGYHRIWDCGLIKYALKKK